MAAVQSVIPADETHDHGLHPDNSLNSVQKALALLNALASVGSKAGLTDLARRVGIPKSTAYRLLSVLTDAGIVERRGTDYLLGLRLFELGAATSRPASLNLRERALPFLEDLYEQTHQTVNLGILEGDEVLYIEKIFGHRSPTTPSHVGGRLPASCVALGKAMLAFSGPGIVRRLASQPLAAMTSRSTIQPGLLLNELKAARASGVAFDREGAELGLTCVAAPIFDVDKHVVAAVSVSSSSFHFDEKVHARAVVRAAHMISTTVMPWLEPQRTQPNRD
ncbi:hypothetical protein B1964_28465 [Gordonia sp. i37]|nr:hypothetical protein B1964_28465 [Gordonia sp. i37]